LVRYLLSFAPLTYNYLKMKKKLLVVFAAIFLAGGSVNAQGVEQGNIIIDPYYGFPNFGKSLAETTSEGLTDVNITGYGPLGMRVEYMVGDRFGIGLDGIINNWGVEGISTVTETDGMGNPVTVTRQDKATMTRYRFQLRFNYHFDLSSPDLDIYLGVGAGTNIRVYKYTVDGVEDPDQTVSGSLIPVSLRLATGARYYFTDNIGINAEIGLGGPVVSAGLSFRF